MMTQAAISPAADERKRVSQLQPATLGEALRMLQARSGLNRDDLAAEATVSKGAMSNYLNDVSMPSALSLRRVVTTLAKHLKTDVNDLWTEVGGVLDNQARMAALDVQADVVRRQKGRPADGGSTD